MQYKLSYRVASPLSNERIEVVANSELELAAAILDMERDVGALCHSVMIEQGNFNDSRSRDQRSALRDIQHYAKVLEKAVHF